MKSLISFALFTILMTSFLQARVPDVAGQQVGRLFERQIQKTLRLSYLLFLPEDYQSASDKAYPLILFLHGAGERGDDIKRVAVHGPPRIVGQAKDFPFIVVSPQCPAGEVWDADTILALLDELLETYRVDADRIYLTGLSMGGFGTWEIGSAAPERFAALVPICGGGRPINVILSGGSRRERLKEIPIWAFHGGKDELVLPEQSKEMIRAFHGIGNKKAKLTIYEMAGHDSWTETYGNPELYDWLLEQRLSKERRGM